VKKKLDSEGKCILALDDEGNQILDDDGNPMVQDEDGNPMVDDDPEEDDPEVDSKRSKVDKIEYRAVEVRASLLGGTDDQPAQKVLEGRPIVFDTTTPLFIDWRGDQWYERIDHNALEGVDLSNVVLKYNHSMHVPPLASTKGGSLDLTVDAKGMGVVARLANTTQASDIHELVRSGNLDKMSFAFSTESDNWDEKTKTRTIYKFDKIYDVSVVDFPAYEDTSVSARSRLKSEQEQRHKELHRKDMETKAKEAKRLADEEARALAQKEQETKDLQTKAEEQRKRQILKIRTML